MSFDVVCLRPEADFLRVGVTPPKALKISYRAPDDAELARLLRDARALVMSAVGPKLPASLMDKSALKLIQVTGAGVDRLDEDALKRFGIPVANVPGGSNDAVAEYVVAAASVLLRRLAWSDQEVRAGRYKEFRAALLAANLTGLNGLTVGIVGMGTIGIAVAKALRAYDCEILYCDPSPRDSKSAAQLGARPAPLDMLLARSDVVTVHVPLFPATRGMIAAPQLAKMKKERSPARRSMSIRSSRQSLRIRCSLWKAMRRGACFSRLTSLASPARHRSRFFVRPGRTSSACWCRALPR